MCHRTRWAHDAAAWPKSARRGRPVVLRRRARARPPASARRVPRVRRARRAAGPATGTPPRGTGPTGSANGGQGGSSSPYALDVSEASFQADVLELSVTVPVVVDLWASAGPGSGAAGAEFSDLLVRLSAQGAGRWVLARIDVATNPRIAQAFGVQAAPAVFAVLKGQPVPLFSEALPEPAVRQYLDELLRVAQANGVSGQVGPVSAPPQALPVEELVEPELDQAYDAIERDDLDGAVEAYRRLLNRKPADATAQAGLSQVELLRRTRGLDPAAVRRDAAERPDDVAGPGPRGGFRGARRPHRGRLRPPGRAGASQRRGGPPAGPRASGRALRHHRPRRSRVAKARTALANALF